MLTLEGLLLKITLQFDLKVVKISLEFVITKKPL